MAVIHRLRDPRTEYHTDARLITCNACGRSTYASGNTPEDARWSAARSGWSSDPNHPRAVADYCPSCTRLRAESAGQLTLI